MELENKYSQKWIGKEFKTNQGYFVKVVDGGSKIHHCVIQLNAQIKEVRCGDLKSGNIKNLYHPSIYGIGYLGEGKYKVTIKGKQTKCYSKWNRMLQRCYSVKFQLKHPTYVDCNVCTEWLCYQTFAKWYNKNYYEIPNIKLELDKDLMIKGNKIYSPNTCKFIPDYANVFLANNKKYSKSGHTGVSWNKNMNKYQAQINDTKSETILYLGCFDDKLEAFKAYKDARRIQCVNIYDKMINDGVTDQDVLDKFKSGNL